MPGRRNSRYERYHPPPGLCGPSLRLVDDVKIAGMRTPAHPANPTEPDAKELVRRAAYVAAHRPYFAFIAHLLETARLPTCRCRWANVTTISALTTALTRLHPEVIGLNGIVLGRVMHRVVPGLLTWHGEVHPVAVSPYGTAIFGQTTAYRFPELWRARQSFELCTGRTIRWNSLTEWQSIHDHDDEASPHI